MRAFVRCWKRPRRGAINQVNGLGREPAGRLPGAAVVLVGKAGAGGPFSRMLRTTFRQGSSPVVVVKAGEISLPLRAAFCRSLSRLWYVFNEAR
jgi:hypothetical protein